MRAGATLLNEARHLAGIKGSGGYGGLMIPCLGRGEQLYGERGVESALLADALEMPDLALAGLYAGGEIGPVGSRTFVHTYTTTVGLLRAK